MYISVEQNKYIKWETSPTWDHFRVGDWKRARYLDYGNPVPNHESLTSENISALNDKYAVGYVSLFFFLLFVATGRS